MPELEVVEFEAVEADFQPCDACVERELAARGIVPIMGGAYSNGRIPLSALVPIAGGTYLDKPAGSAWNAMSAEIKRERGVQIVTNGNDSAYRNYDRQVYWRNYWCSRGQCQNAATPGFSNHGLGIAVDVPEWVRALIVIFGGKFGWDRGCSDAPWETWHHKWCGGWSGQNPGTTTPRDRYPVLKKGRHGSAVRRAQRHLVRWNNGFTKPNVDGSFGDGTKKAVREFQMIHFGADDADGIIGKQTWRALRHKDYLKPDERWRVNHIRYAMASGDEVSKWERDELQNWRQWCVDRQQSIRKVSQENGWQGEDRMKRYKILRNAAGPLAPASKNDKKGK